MKSKKLRFLGFLLIAVLIAVLTMSVVSCTTKTTTMTKALISISVTPSSTGSLAVGTAASFSAVGTYSDNSTADITNQATWTSDNTAAATLSPGGTATAVAAGTANVTASLSGITSPSVKLTVISLSSISVTPAALPILTVGATQQFSAAGTYSDGSIVNITSQVNWASDNSATVAITSNGLATVASAGTANITATLNGVTSAKVLLTAETIVSIDVQPAIPAKLSVRSSQRLSATAKFTDGSTGDVSSLVNWTWTGSSSGIVSIGPTGVITGGAVGTANITATLNGVSSPAVLFTVVTP